MTNFQVYRKTLSFSLVMFLVGLGGLAVLGGFTVLGFVITNQPPLENGVVGAIIGFILGCIGAALINLFITNRFKAAQIAMMTRGVTEGNLPDKGTFKEGLNEMKGKFGKITVFFFITNAIKSLFKQIGRGVTGAATAIGGQTGNTVGNVIDSAVQTLIGYLCDCCLGWILYRKDQNAFRSGCEGAVIFFKHGKTMIRNVGRIFGMGILSFLVIGGAFFGLSYLIFSQFPDMANQLAAEISSWSEEPSPIFENGTVFTIAASIIVGVLMWSLLHSVLIRPFILTGVLRNYMAAGQADLPTEKDMQEMNSKFPRFGKLYNKVQ